MNNNECKEVFDTLVKMLNYQGLVSDLSAKDAIFVANTSSNSVEKLLSSRKRKWEHNLIPSATVEISRLRHDFQSAYKQYKAR